MGPAVAPVGTVAVSWVADCIVNAAGISQCLEISFGSDAPGVRVNLFDDNGFEPAQRWGLTLMATATATKPANAAALKTEVYPNPAAAGQCLMVRVEAGTCGAAEVEVPDVLGKKIFAQHETLSAGSNVLALQNKLLGAGVYVLRVRQGEFIQQTRVVQQ